MGLPGPGAVWIWDLQFSFDTLFTSHRRIKKITRLLNIYIRKWVNFWLYWDSLRLSNTSEKQIFWSKGSELINWWFCLFNFENNLAGWAIQNSVKTFSLSKIAGKNCIYIFLWAKYFYRLLNAYLYEWNDVKYCLAFKELWNLKCTFNFFIWSTDGWCTFSFSFVITISNEIHCFLWNCFDSDGSGLNVVNN